MSEDLISKQTAYKVLSEYYHHKTEMQHKALREALDMVPPVDIDLSDYSDRLWRKAYEQGKADAEVERKTWRWNDHEVACIIADLMGDACACNHNGIDEWLPKFCDFANTDACPNPVGVACWEQFLKHRAERRTDE